MTVKNNQQENAPRVMDAVITAPTVGAGEGAFYIKDVGGIAEAFYIDSNGQEVQITSNGSMNSGGVLGEINTASNVGTGTGLVFKQKTGEDLELRKIKAGTNITVAVVGDDIEISGPPSSGEANTASNVGTGNQVFKQKTGIDFEFRTLKAGTNVTLVSSLDEITINAAGGSGSSLTIQDEGGLIDNAVTTMNFTGPGVTASQTSPGVVQIAVTGGGGGETNTASNLGAGEGVFSTKVGADLQFKSLVAGTNVSLSSDANTITISSTGGGSGETNTASNVGAGGVGVFKQKTGADLEFKNINSGEGISVTNDAGNDEIDVAVNVNGLAAEASLDGAADFVMVYDTSAGGHRKALLNNLPTGGGGEANTASNVGGETELFKQKSGIDLQFRTLVAGSNVTLTQNADTVEIAASGSGGAGTEFRFKLPAAGTLAQRINIAEGIPGDIPAGITLYQGDDPSVDATLGATANDLVVAHSTGNLPMVTTIIAEVAPNFTQAKRIDFTTTSANDRIVSNIGRTQFRITNIQNEVATFDRIEGYINLV